jgi:hypothetical protein
MLVINKTKGNSIYFGHILRTDEQEAFIQAIIDRQYDGTEEWSTSDSYLFKETPDEVVEYDEKDQVRVRDYYDDNEM